MKRTFLIIAAIVLMALGSMTEAKSYTFDSNNEGWQQSTVGYNGGGYETLIPNTNANWTNSYGVGSIKGSIYQTSNGTSWEGRPYWMGTKDITAANTFGDLTGKSLQASIRSTANWAGRVSGDTVYARWTITQEGLGTGGIYSNMWVSKAAYSINLNDTAFGSGTDTDWVLKSIKLEEGNFFQWPNYTNNGSFADVLTNYTSFGLAILPTTNISDVLSDFNGGSGTWGTGSTLLHYGATATGNSATWGVDNFAAAPVPIPSAILLFAPGLAGLVGLKRKYLG
jgi:hypothetical protein